MKFYLIQGIIFIISITAHLHSHDIPSYSPCMFAAQRFEWALSSAFLDRCKPIVFDQQLTTNNEKKADSAVGICNIVLVVYPRLFINKT